MRFSERIGKRAKKVDIQIDYMDEELRNGLWNVFSILISEPMEKHGYLSGSNFKDVIQAIWISFFKEPVDEIPVGTRDVTLEIRKRFFEWDFLEVYDFIDFLAELDQGGYDFDEFTDSCDVILKRELSGYRFVSGKLAPITSEMEIQQIEDILASSSDNALHGVHIHFSTALSMLADRKSPDYRNSIKESISAIESICKLISGEKNVELKAAIKKLKTILPIHGALEQGFIKLYGWTSDGDGIRHAMMDESNLDQEDALYMLVSCSSFANYLITKADKLGIEIK